MAVTPDERYIFAFAQKGTYDSHLYKFDADSGINLEAYEVVSQYIDSYTFIYPTNSNLYITGFHYNSTNMYISTGLYNFKISDSSVIVITLSGRMRPTYWAYINEKIYVIDTISISPRHLVYSMINTDGNFYDKFHCFVF